MKVEQLTKKVGQVARHGKVIAVKGSSIEVTWDDDHTSIVSPESLHALSKKSKA
jgi:hypothetical protein